MPVLALCTQTVQHMFKVGARICCAPANQSWKRVKIEATDVMILLQIKEIVHNEQWACLQILGNDCSSGAPWVNNFWCLIMKAVRWWRWGQNLSEVESFHLEMGQVDPFLCWREMLEGPCSVLQTNWCEKNTNRFFFYPLDHIATVLFWFIVFIAIVSRCSQRVGRQVGGYYSHKRCFATYKPPWSFGTVGRWWKWCSDCKKLEGNLTLMPDHSDHSGTSTTKSSRCKCFLCKW